MHPASPEGASLRAEMKGGLARPEVTLRSMCAVSTEPIRHNGFQAS